MIIITAFKFLIRLSVSACQMDVAAPSIDTSMRAQIIVLEEQRQEVRKQRSRPEGTLFIPTHTDLSVNTWSLSLQLLSINEKWAKEFRAMKQYYKDKVRGNISNSSFLVLNLLLQPSSPNYGLNFALVRFLVSVLDTRKQFNLLRSENLPK